MLTLHITSPCGKGQLALGPRDRRESAKKSCAERLTVQQVQRVFYDVHIKSEDRYFWCSAWVDGSLASTGRKSHTLFQKSPCWVQALLHSILFSSYGSYWLVFTSVIPRVWYRFPLTPVSSVWAEWSKVLQMFQLGIYWNRLCFASLQHHQWTLSPPVKGSGMPLTMFA